MSETSLCEQPVQRRRGRRVRVALPPGAMSLIGYGDSRKATGLVLVGNFPDNFAALRWLLERAAFPEQMPACR